MTNFYEETSETLKSIGKTLEDVAYVSLNGKNYKPEKFFDVIKGIEYDSGYGAQEINASLEIVFNDSSHLERREYDGSEWWSYVSPRPLNVELEDFPDDAEIKES